MRDSELSSLLRNLKNVEWGTKTSLPIYAVATVIIEAVILGFLREAGVVLATGHTLLLFGVSVILIAVTWVFKWIRLYSPKDLVIGIAVKVDDEGSKYYRQLKDTISKSIAQQNLEKDVELREFPGDVYFTVPKKAEKFIESKGIRVLVWGDALTGTSAGVESIRFSIKISYQYGSTSPEGKAAVEGLLRDTNRRGFWDIQKTNSLPTLQIVAGNVVEMSLFTLAICLDTLGEPGYTVASTQILESLDKQLQQRIQDDNFPNLDYVRDQIRRLRIGSYEKLRQYYYNVKNDHVQAHIYAEKSLEIAPNDWKVHQDISVTFWLSGNISEAKKHTREALRLNPKDELAKLNLAFFNFVEGSYKKGLIKYTHLKPKLLAKTNILKVIGFVLDEYDKTKNIALLFAAGWLNCHYADENLGKSQLKKFLELANNDKEFECLTIAAESLVNTSS